MMRAVMMTFRHPVDDLEFYQDYREVLVSVHPDGPVIAKYGGQAVRGRERAVGFVDGLKFMWPELKVHGQQVPDFT